MVERLSDWPKRLAGYLASKRTETFAWGVNDCMTLMADGVWACTGTDYWAEFRGYTDEAGADAILAEYPIQDLISYGLGFQPRIPEKRLIVANRGDAVLVKLRPGQSVGSTNGLMAGLVDDSGEGIAAFSTNGFIRLPLSMVVAVWSY